MQKCSVYCLIFISNMKSSIHVIMCHVILWFYMIHAMLYCDFAGISWMMSQPMNFFNICLWFIWKKTESIYHWNVYTSVHLHQIKCKNIIDCYAIFCLAGSLVTHDKQTASMTYCYDVCLECGRSGDFSPAELFVGCLLNVPAIC